MYDLPLVLGESRSRALVVGAGTGNDVQAALRNGYASVGCVEIDPRIVELGRRLHPERPYDDPRVFVVVDDGRAFFEQYRGESFDVIDYGLVDSHAMFTALSTLRLDNYLYTEEGLRAAWRHLKPDGILAVNFSVAGGSWLRDRIYRTLASPPGRRRSSSSTTFSGGPSSWPPARPRAWPGLGRSRSRSPSRPPPPSARRSRPATTGRSST